MDQSEYIVTYIDWDKIDVWCCGRYFSSQEIDQHVEKVHETCETSAAQDDLKESEKSKEKVQETCQTKPVQDDSIESEKLKAESEKKVYLCKICQKSFFTPNIAKIHMKTHKNNNEGKVEPLVLDKSANEPTKKATKTRKYSCYICDKIFNYSGDLKKHKRVHTKEKPFSCSFCGKAFSQSCNRNTHVQLKHSPLDEINSLGTFKKLQLKSGEIDNKSSIFKGDFIQNQDKFAEVHWGEDFIERKSHKEKEVNVDKSRSEDVNLDVGKNQDLVFKREKLVKNGNEENFLCSYPNCSKSFATKTGLKQHMFGHTGAKPFKCDECAKLFARKSILKNHKLIHTRALKHLKCDKPPMEKDETFPKVREENVEEVSHEKKWSQNSQLLTFPVDETIEPIPSETMNLC